MPVQVLVQHIFDTWKKEHACTNLEPCHPCSQDNCLSDKIYSLAMEKVKTGWKCSI